MLMPLLSANRTQSTHSPGIQVKGYTFDLIANLTVLIRASVGDRRNFNSWPGQNNSSSFLALPNQPTPIGTKRDKEHIEMKVWGHRPASWAEPSHSYNSACFSVVFYSL